MKKNKGKGFKRINIDVPEKVHTAWKHEAIDRGMKLKELIMEKLMGRPTRAAKRRARRVEPEKVEGTVSQG